MKRILLVALAFMAHLSFGQTQAEMNKEAYASYLYRQGKRDDELAKKRARLEKPGDILNQPDSLGKDSLEGGQRNEVTFQASYLSFSWYSIPLEYKEH